VVTQLALVVYRGALRLYPRSFRREYETALVQCVVDQHTFESRGLLSVVARELPDVAGSALRMRGESPMARFVVVIVTLVVAALAALAAGPMALVPVLVVAVAIVWGMRSAPPLDAARETRPARWFAGAAVAVVAAVMIPVVDGGELSEPAWAVMAVLMVAGVALAVTGLAFLFGPARREPTPTA
jgi:hypothetical protein